MIEERMINLGEAEIGAFDRRVWD